MQFGLTIALMALLLLPAISFAHGPFSGYARREQPRNHYYLEHPRYSSSYCHRHRYPLHADDRRRHCHESTREYRDRGHFRYYPDNFRYPRGRYDRSYYWPWYRFGR